jgi:hypothetical protein
VQNEATVGQGTAGAEELKADQKSNEVGIGGLREMGVEERALEADEQALGRRDLGAGILEERKPLDENRAFEEPGALPLEENRFEELKALENRAVDRGVIQRVGLEQQTSLGTTEVELRDEAGVSSTEQNDEAGNVGTIETESGEPGVAE